MECRSVDERDLRRVAGVVRVDRVSVRGSLYVLLPVRSDGAYVRTDTAADVFLVSDVGSEKGSGAFVYGSTTAMNGRSSGRTTGLVDGCCRSVVILVSGLVPHSHHGRESGSNGRNEGGRAPLFHKGINVFDDAN